MNPVDFNYTNLDNSWQPPPEDVGLKNVLIQWGFSDLYPLFQVQEITLERLKLLTTDDIKELLTGCTVGTRADFRQKLFDWKIEVGASTISTCETLSNASSLSYDVPKFVQQSWNLLEIIKKIPNGQYVLNYFNCNKKLDDVSRKLIVDAIIAYHHENGKKINREQFLSISKEIQEVFNDDQQIYYKIHNQIPSGRLYDKYYNSNKRLKKLGLANISAAKSIAEDSVEETEPQVVVINEEQENLRLWLTINVEPWEEIQRKWTETFELRRNHVLVGNSEKCTILLEHWPLIKHPHAFTLIDLDFLKLFPDKGYNLIKNWKLFKTKILPIFNEKIKDKQNVNLLKLINTAKDKNDSCYDLLIALLLHALLPPTIRHKRTADNAKKIITKATIRDSQDTFFLHVFTENDFERKIVEHHEIIRKRNGTIQPLIIGIGEELTGIKNFFVYFDNVKYKFDNFLSAFDSCFKIHHALHLKYSAEAELFWTFIQKQVYEIQSSYDISNANLLCLLNDLSN